MDVPIRYDILKEDDVAMRVRDGTILRSDIYRPNAPGKFPALLFRTPYDKRRSDFGRETYVPVGMEAARHGYVVVMQDIRGRFASDGEFFPFFDPAHVRDAEDGYDAVEWVASLPYCDGKVGTFGDSYGGWAQWELARLRPPHLVAMLPSGMPATAIDYPILRVRRILWLMYRMAPETHRRAKSSGPYSAEDAYSIWDAVERGKWYWFLPWKELPQDALGDLAPYFNKLLDQMPVDYVAQQRAHDQIAAPALHMTGWFDISAGRSIQHFSGMRQNGMTEHARYNQKLIVGPWTHMDPYYDLTRKTGDVDFGADAAADYVSIMVRWFDYWLKGIENNVMQEPPIKLFIMGDNVWRDEYEFPLRRTVFTDYYFHSGGLANTPSGNGTLSRTPPGDERPDKFVYDPRDPVMSIFSAGAYYEPRDQKPLDYRRDMLVFTSAPLGAEMEITGPITVHLWAATSAPDTDFTAKLVDVSPQGVAIGITSGIVRARYRDSVERPGPVEPGTVYQYSIELEPTAWVMKAGHRIRVDISSSDFPNYDRNHNTGVDYYSDPVLVPAQQTIFHDSAHPSRIVLPIIPK